MGVCVCVCTVYGDCLGICVFYWKLRDWRLDGNWYGVTMRTIIRFNLIPPSGYSVAFQRRDRKRFIKIDSRIEIFLRRWSGDTMLRYYRIRLHSGSSVFCKYWKGRGKNSQWWPKAARCGNDHLVFEGIRESATSTVTLTPNRARIRNRLVNHRWRGRGRDGESYKKYFRLVILNWNVKTSESILERGTLLGTWT